MLIKPILLIIAFMSLYLATHFIDPSFFLFMLVFFFLSTYSICKNLKVKFLYTLFFMMTFSIILRFSFTISEFPHFIFWGFVISFYVIFFAWNRYKNYNLALIFGINHLVFVIIAGIFDFYYCQSHSESMIWYFFLYFDFPIGFFIGFIGILPKYFVDSVVPNIVQTISITSSFGILGSIWYYYIGTKIMKKYKK